MDLTKLSDDDLMALKSGDLSKVSDTGLMALKGEQTPAVAPKRGGVNMRDMLGDQYDRTMNYTGRDQQAAAARGAGSIGATLLTPIDMAMGNTKSIGNPERRAAMDEGVKAMGADLESVGFKTVKMGTEIAGTAGVGGLLGKVAQFLNASPTAVNALSSAGFTTGPKVAPGVVNALKDTLIRSGAGATVGAGSAGLVDPGEAGTGAKIGATFPLISPVVKMLGLGAKKALGATTGVGDNAISEAFKAGKAGGPQAEQFAKNMRGEVPIDDVLSLAKQNLDEIGRQKSAAYRSGMARLKSDKSVLDLSNITKATDDAVEMSLFKGEVKDDYSTEVLGKVKTAIDKWSKLDPAEYHTPEGLDALKQKIGGILDPIDFKQKAARSAVGKVYAAIKDEITAQAPEYAKVMKDYHKSSELVSEIERALSLNKNASVDTAMRKLQSLMRNNVNTNYGYRADLANQLEQLGGKQIMPALAGQSLNDWIPRGIQRAATGSGGAALLYMGNAPAAAGLAAVSSPRLVGESAFLAGQAAQDNAILRALRQSAYRAAPVAGTQ